MYRFAITLTVLAAAVGMCLAGEALAQTDEFELPPIKLKPERPTRTKPIPPTPDERESEPSEEPAEPSEEPKEEAPPEKEAEPEEPEKKPAEAEAPKPAEKPEGETEEEPEVPLKPEKHEEGTPPTPADLPMPEPPEEAPETGLETIALPEREDVPPALPEGPPVLPDEEPPARPTEVQAEAAEAQVEPTVEPRLDGMGEVGLVEAVAVARKQYERALRALKAYYTQRGNSTKIEWVNTELAAYEKVPKVRYLVATELAGPRLKPSRNIEPADTLYQEGLHYKNYPAFPPGKKDYLKIALQKFRTVIEKYPQSDKIDDAAYRMGEIYGGWYFQDYGRAVQCYERCWQWDPDTPHPARFKAAKIYEEKLKNRDKAVELYNAVIAHSRNEELVNQAQNRLRALTGR